MGTIFSWVKSSSPEYGYQECSNIDCQERFSSEVNDTFLLTNGEQEEAYLNDLAEKFEEVLSDVEDLCLTELEKPIKETVLSLKNLNSSDRKIYKEKAQLSCNCQEWGPDLFDQGKWLCKKCGTECQCNKQGWENLLHENNNKKINNDDDASENQSVVMDESTSNASTLFCRCHSSKEKDINTISCNTTKSIEDILVHEEPKKMLSEPLFDKKSLMELSSKSQSLEKVEDSVSGLLDKTCPCNCGYYQEGDIKMCPCGCDQVIAIKSEEKIINEGPHCACGDAGSNCPNELTLLSTDNDVTGLTTTIELLQMKCRIKDGIIAVLATELRNSDNFDHIVENLAAPCLPHTSIDFDLSMVYEYIKNTSHVESSESIEIGLVPKPQNFRIVRTVLNSLVLAWDLPEKLNYLRGYEILVDGVITSRISNATRSQAILTPIDLSKPKELTIYATAINDRISEPTTISYFTALNT